MLISQGSLVFPEFSDFKSSIYTSERRNDCQIFLVRSPCGSGPSDQLYQMVTAQLKDDEVLFPSEEAFSEAMEVGFFRIKAPKEVDLEAGRLFAKTFTSDPRYTEFGVLDLVNGYLQSEQAQTVRFRALHKQLSAMGRLSCSQMQLLFAQ